jgi:hypothetical protein
MYPIAPDPRPRAGKKTEDLVGSTYGPSQRRVGVDVVHFSYLRRAPTRLPARADMRVHLSAVCSYAAPTSSSLHCQGARPWVVCRRGNELKGTVVLLSLSLSVYCLLLPLSLKGIVVE